MELKLKFLGVLWGILMVSQDLNTYYLYILLLVTSPNTISCNNFLDYYTLFVFINTIASGIFYPISGWITDISANKSALVFLVANIIQLVFISLQILPYCFSELFVDISWFNNKGWIILCVFWQVTQLVSIQNVNSLWKLIKQITEKERNTDNNKNNLQLVNSIGNIGDLTSDITETLTLSILAIVILFVKSDMINYKFILIYIFIAITLLNLILCVTSIYLFTSNKNENVNEFNIRKDTKKPKILPHKWLYSSIKNFYKQKIAYHAFWHCILLGIYATIVQYPLSLIEVSIINVSNNLCNGVLTNLLLLGATTNLCYLIGSISYRLFVVNASPIRFYRWYYPIGALSLLGITTALWFKMYYIITLILISFATMIPYYLTYYDYFLFTEQSQGKSYGFVLGLYGTINTIITASIQSLYYIGISFGLILGFSIVLLVLSIIYSYYLAYAVNKKQMEEVHIAEPLISVNYQ